MPGKASKIKKIVFVIMPFTETPKRNKDDLTEFFETNLKKPIESEGSLKYQYIVKRSDDTFDITAQIIRDIYTADIVLCDLSGHNANPNVMYELGMRLAISNKPVILFREEDPNNRRIFDIAGFYAYEYSPQQYRKLESYIIGKLRKFETGEEVYQSPVFKILKTEPNVVAEIDRRKVEKLLMSFLQEARGLQRAIGGALDVFLNTYNIHHSFKTADETLEFLGKNRKRLYKLPWENFVFHPQIMPAVNAFLVDLPLEGLVPKNLEIDVNSFISEYYQTYLASDYVWHLPNLTVVYTFLGESYFLRQILSGCLLLVRGTLSDEEGQQIIDSMFNFIARSALGVIEKTDASVTDSKKVESLVKVTKKLKKTKTKKRKSSKNLYPDI